MLVACCTGIGVGLLLVAAVDHNTIREHADRISPFALRAEVVCSLRSPSALSRCSVRN